MNVNLSISGKEWNRKRRESKVAELTDKVCREEITSWEGLCPELQSEIREAVTQAVIATGWRIPKVKHPRRLIKTICTRRRAGEKFTEIAADLDMTRAQVSGIYYRHSGDDSKPKPVRLRRSDGRFAHMDEGVREAAACPI